MKLSKKIFLSTLIFFSLSAKHSLACAFGCNVFNVGTSSLLPNSEGGIVFLQYDYANQNRNWHNDHKSTNEQNHSDHEHDKQIRSQIITAGTQYMFNRKWGFAMRVPYLIRQNKTAMLDEDSGAEIISKNNTKSVGDVRLNAIYSGFFEDMSTGVSFGLKLPTGKTKAEGLERNMQIGTGSTDSILGAYTRGKIGNSEKLKYFAQTSWDHAFLSHHNFTPGDEFTLASGVYYNAGSIAKIKNVAPILQFTGAKKLRDKGWAADHSNSGYTQIFLAPAFELNLGSFKTYADVEFPLYQNVNGNQLVVGRLYKIILGYSF